jgi:hypothetical protein
MSKNRMDLEMDIMSFYNFAHQIKSLSHGVMERDMTRDDIVNALNGLQKLLELHIEDTYDTFVETFNLKTDDDNNMPNLATQYHE